MTSIRDLVVVALAELGRATAQQVCDKLKDAGVTLEQVRAALRDCSHLRRVKCSGRIPRHGGRGGCVPSLYWLPGTEANYRPLAELLRDMDSEEESLFTPNRRRSTGPMYPSVWAYAQSQPVQKVAKFDTAGYEIPQFGSTERRTA